MKIFQKILIFISTSLFFLSLFAGCNNSNSTDRQVLALAEKILFNNALSKYTNQLTNDVFSNKIIQELNSPNGEQAPGYDFLKDLLIFKTAFNNAQGLEQKSKVLEQKVSGLRSALSKYDPSIFEKSLPESVISTWYSSSSFKQLFFDPITPSYVPDHAWYIIYKFINGLLTQVNNSYLKDLSKLQKIQENFQTLIDHIQPKPNDPTAACFDNTSFPIDFHNLYNSVYFPSTLQQNIDTTSSKVLFHNGDDYYISVRFLVTSSLNGITFHFNNSTYIIDNIALQ